MRSLRPVSPGESVAGSDLTVPIYHSEQLSGYMVSRGRCLARRGLCLSRTQRTLPRVGGKQIRRLSMHQFPQGMDQTPLFTSAIAEGVIQWGLVSFDCSGFWVRDRSNLTEALDITPPFLRSTEGDAGS